MVALIALVAACLRVGPPSGDFANYWTAAALWLDGADLGRLYDYRWFTDQAARLGFGDRLVGFPVLTPPSVLFAVPLVPLGVEGAGRAWLFVQTLLAGLTAVAAARTARVPAWAGVLALAAVWPSMRGHLQQGQFHLVAVAMVALGLWAWRRERAALAGGAWALAAGLKIFAWPLLLLVAAVRAPRAIAAAALTLVLGAALSVGLLGWELHGDWLREIAPATAGGWFTDPWHPGQQSLHAALKYTWSPHVGLGDPTAVAHPRLARALPMGLVLLPLAIAAGGLSWERLTDGARSRLLAAASVAAIVTAPNIARYALVLVVPGALLAVVETWRERRRPLALGIALAAAAPAWVAVPGAWPDVVVAGIPRFWALLGFCLLVFPWRGFGPSRLAATGLSVLLVGALALGMDVVATDIDGAVAQDSAAMPLIAADLVAHPDGSLYLSGLAEHRAGQPGRGWLGYVVREGQVEVAQASPTTHVFSPVVHDGRLLSWSLGPDGAARPEPVPCAGGWLLEVEHDGQQDIAWRAPTGQQQRLTTHPGHDAWPACGSEHVWFLSDRGVGVRALRLWRVALPEGG